MASMEPQRLRRGKQWCRARCGESSYPQLQWSHSVSAVERMLDTADYFGAYHASLEQQRLRRGTDDHFPLRVELGIASMEPQRLRRGKVVRRRLLRNETYASMEPQRLRRGKARNMKRNARPLKMLQWSHSVSAVERRMRRARFHRQHRLQWSHSVSAVESCKAHNPAGEVPWLQWSHSVSAVESRWHETKRNPSRVLQWSHSVSAVERSPVSSVLLTPISLQWSHSVSAVERTAPYMHETRSSCASMEPQRLRRGK